MWSLTQNQNPAYLDLGRPLDPNASFQEMGGARSMLNLSPQGNH